MIELVPMAYRVANDVDAGPEGTAVQKGGEKERKSGESRMDEDEERDAVFYRLETLGYRVGQGLVERYVKSALAPRCRGHTDSPRGWPRGWESRQPARSKHADNPRASRFSRDRPRFVDTLDVIKFLCKDIWMLVFRKQIDNLKTNHRVPSPLLKPRDTHLTSAQGVYVLTDNSFRPFSRMSTEAGGQAVARAQPVRPRPRLRVSASSSC